MKINVSSEIGHLNGVIVHTPGNEVSLVNPEIADELLFDDIIFEDDAREQHLAMLDIFKAAMKTDGKVIEIADLFLETLKIGDASPYFVEQLIKEFPQENLQVIESELLALSPIDLLKFSIQGVLKTSTDFNLHPSPNLLFTRDLAVVCGNSILMSRAATHARLRESLIMETIVTYHPLFETVRSNAVRISGHQSIEGGDVLIQSDKLVLIGMSERTSFTGLMKASEGLFDKGVETVLAVDIPKQRASMHLDTVFTFISDTECVAFPPAILEQKDNIVALQKEGDKIVTEQRSQLQSALKEFSGIDYNFIKCGGEDRTSQFREQWTDGANMFALAPGVVVGYDRNTKTFNALVDNGYSYMTQFEFVEEYENKDLELNEDTKIAISFQGHELCRGRGGARCMTMPISRDPLNL